MTFRFLQAIVLTMAFAGWIFYQIFFKKKKWGDIKSDALAIVFFASVWFAVYYWFIN